MQFLASVVSVEHDLATVKVGGKEAGPAVGWPYARGLASSCGVDMKLTGPLLCLNVICTIGTSMKNSSRNYLLLSL